MKRIEIPKQKTIALIAHDNKKDDMLQWVARHREELSRHKLCGTGTTSSLIRDSSGLEIKSFRSGPLGGDMQIGAEIVDGEIDMVIFLWDPMSAHPHDPDVRALLRVATLYDIPMANNISTADFMLASTLMDEVYIVGE